jgi:hypothetical protein
MASKLFDTPSVKASDKTNLVSGLGQKKTMLSLKEVLRYKNQVDGMLEAMIEELQELPKDLQTNLDRGKITKTVKEVIKCSLDFVGK